jgi:NTP pyrophosphatase (non-canonical NTP hydrolase)
VASFAEAIKRAKDVLPLFSSEKEWTIEAFMVELQAEVGTLSDTIMIKEAYRSLRPGDTLDLEDDIADVLFVLFLIADHYGIDLDHAYNNMIETTHRKLKDKPS